MALIEKYIVVADHWPVQAGQEITRGMIVKLDPTTGEVVLASGASGETAIGIAGDTKSVQVSGLADTNNALLGAVGGVTGAGTAQQFVNRISDTFDETKASARMTVYHSGGLFATNEYDVDLAAALIGDPLYCSATSRLKHTLSTSAQVIGILTQKPGPYDSGVPGTDVRGSMTLGNFLEFKLVI